MHTDRKERPPVDGKGRERDGKFTRLEDDELRMMWFSGFMDFHGHLPGRVARSYYIVAPGSTTRNNEATSNIATSSPLLLVAKTLCQLLLGPAVRGFRSQPMPTPRWTGRRSVLPGAARTS